VWRLRSLSCSAHHCAAVTTEGLLFTWGSGSDGELGHGSHDTLRAPRLVEYFGLMHPLRVVDAAAGGTSGACHTVVVAAGNLASEAAGTARVSSQRAAAAAGNAVAPLGRLFTFGGGAAGGRGNYAATAEPALVEAWACDLYSPAHGGVRSVAAGDGFCLALTASGALYSWGTWAGGRLGLGATNPEPGRDPTRPLAAPPSPDAPPAPLPRFILTPLRVAVGTDVAPTLPPRLLAPVPRGTATVALRQVAAGSAHAAAVDVAGGVWCWGAGAGGSLGMGSTSDSYTPRRLPIAADDGAAVRFVRVAAGRGHSAAIATDGSLWVWGGGGGDGSVVTTAPAPAAEGGGDDSDGDEASRADVAGATSAPPPGPADDAWARPQRHPVWDGSSPERRACAVAAGTGFTLVAGTGSELAWLPVGGGGPGGGVDTGEGGGGNGGRPYLLAAAGGRAVWARGYAPATSRRLTWCATSGAYDDDGGRSGSAAPRPRSLPRDAPRFNAVLVSDDVRVPVHAALIAARSAVLARRLLTKAAARGGTRAGAALLQVHVPEVAGELLPLVVEAAYADTLLALPTLSPAVARALAPAAAALDLPHLAAACAAVTASASAFWARGLTGPAAGGDSSGGREVVIPGARAGGSEEAVALVASNTGAAAAAVAAFCGTTAAAALCDALLLTRSGAAFGMHLAAVQAAAPGLLAACELLRAGLDGYRAYRVPASLGGTVADAAWMAVLAYATTGSLPPLVAHADSDIVADLAAAAGIPVFTPTAAAARAAAAALSPSDRDGSSCAVGVCAVAAALDWPALGAAVLAATHDLTSLPPPVVAAAAKNTATATGRALAAVGAAAAGGAIVVGGTSDAAALRRDRLDGGAARALHLAASNAAAGAAMVALPRAVGTTTTPAEPMSADTPPAAKRPAPSLAQRARRALPAAAATLALAVLAVAYHHLAAYNTSLTPWVPVANVAVVVIALALAARVVYLK